MKSRDLTLYKSVFITGGASGLGKAIALHYAKKNFNVAIGDINEVALKETKALLQEHARSVLAFHCDSRKIASLEEARSVIEGHWGSLDILVNNAGVAGTFSETEKVSLGDWETVLDINVLGVVRGVKTFASMFKKQSSGAIVNIASMAGILSPPNAAAYNASKAAVISLSETIRYEMLPYSVSVHVVCPAFFKTNLTESMKSAPKAKAFVDREMDKSSLSADDIAAMIANQIDHNQFMLLTHKKERRIWRFKRFLPLLYDKVAIKTFRKILKKAEITPNA